MKEKREKPVSDVTANSKKIRNLVITAIMAALIVVLQYLSTIIKVGPVSITLTLIPIVICSVFLGWKYGTALGLVFGLVVSIFSLVGLDPGGQMIFQANPALAWVLCLLKGAAAGFFPAVVYRFFSRNKRAAEVLMALSGAFIFLAGFFAGQLLAGKSLGVNVAVTVIVSVVAAGYLLLINFALKKENSAFYLASMAAPVANTGIFIIGTLIFFRSTLSAWAGGSNLVVYLFTGVIMFNFLIEFTLAILLAPAVATVVKAVRKRTDK